MPETTAKVLVLKNSRAYHDALETFRKFMNADNGGAEMQPLCARPEDTHACKMLFSYAVGTLVKPSLLALDRDFKFERGDGRLLADKLNEHYKLEFKEANPAT